MTRVRYTERQRLRAQDLCGQQDYLLGLAGRHYIGPHAWGIVRGLSVIVENNKAIITPGLAIDGYGRELLVRENIEQPLLANVPGQFVYLFYCERPSGGCAGSNSRWRDSAEVVIRESSWPISDGESNLSLARAAGSIGDGPPWPILLGFINANKVVVSSEVRFTRVSAARVASATKRAIMRIGQENLADRYHFRVSAQDGKDTLRDRFAINLDGNTSIWGNLALEGSAFEQVIRLSAEQFVRVESKSAIASDFFLRVTRGIERGQPVVTVAVRRKGELKTAFKQNFTIDNQRSVKARANSFNKSAIRFVEGRIEAVVHGEATASESKKKFDDLVDQESSLERAGGVLKFDVETVQPATRFCGCGDENDNEAELPAGLIFKPVAKAPTSLTSRDIYSIAVKDADQTSIEEVRMSGGLFADGDFKPRVTFAGSSPLQPWLFVRGNGDIELPGGQSRVDGSAFDMIRVIGTAIYPPVKPDPRDPLFNKLLVFAFVRGVMVFSPPLLEIIFSNTPKVIELGKPWEYELQLRNLSKISPLTMKKSFEILTTDSVVTNTDFIELEKLEINETIKVKITHEEFPEDIQPKTLVIDVSVQMDADGKPVAVAATSEVIPVYGPPSIDTSSIPDSVEAGKEVRFGLTIRNGNSERVTIKSIQVDVLDSTEELNPQTAELALGASTPTTNGVAITPPANINNFEVAVTVKFDWAKPNVDGVVQTTKIVSVENNIVG